MISLPPSVRIYLYGAPVDGRMGFDALAGLVASALGIDPLCGHLFVFFAARGRIARILFFDHNGFALYSKRLERGRFVLRKPSANNVIAAGSGQPHLRARVGLTP